MAFPRIRSPRARRAGSIAVIFALCLIVLLGFGAMALDWGAVSATRAQLQAAADSAALAATAEMDDPTTALALARAYARKHAINGIEPSISDDGLEFGTWDGSSFTADSANPEIVRVTVRASVQMTLTRLFGVETVDLVAVAGAGPNVVAKRAPDLAVMLDVTGSMSLSELASERTAAQALLDCVAENATDDSRMSLGVFTGVDTILVDMTEVGSGYSTLSSYISKIKGCGSTGMPACSGTNHAAGLGGAMAMLEAANTPEDVGQAVLVMSDGEPNADSICTSSNYTSTGWRPDLKTLCDARKTCVTKKGKTTCTQSQPTESTYLTWVQDQQEECEDTDIDVYTVYYGTETAGIAYLEDNLRAGDGFSLNTPTASQMADAFEEICTAYTSSSPGLVF